MNGKSWNWLQVALKAQLISEAIGQTAQFLAIIAILLTPIWLPACIERFNP